MVKYQKGEDLIKISLNLPRDLWKKVRLRAVNEDKTATEIVVDLIEHHLKKKGKPND